MYFFPHYFYQPKDQGFEERSHLGNPELNQILNKEYIRNIPETWKFISCQIRSD